MTLPDAIEVRDERDQLYKINVATIGEGGESTQRDDPDLGTPDDCIEPPESLERLAAWTQMNGTRASCLWAMTRNTVGLGYDLRMRDGHEQEGRDPRELIRRARERLESLAAADRRLERPSFTGLMGAAKWDQEEVGNGYLEVARNRVTGLVSGLHHAPGKRVRRLKDRTGYVLLPPSGDLDAGTRFYNFGEKVQYDERGVPTGKLGDGKTWLRNELLSFRLYTSESRDYGLPRDVSLALEYLGDKGAAESNVDFFANGGALPTVLFVQGEEKREGGTISVNVPPEVTQQINAVLNSRGRGRTTGGGRVAVIPLPQGVKAQREVLGQASNLDIGYIDFRSDVRARTLSAFRLGEVFIALSGDGRYDAEVQRALAKEQVFDGEQEQWQERLDACILRETGFPELELVFKDLAIEDDAARRASADSMALVQTITNREHREAHGFGPLPESASEDEHEAALEGKVPKGWNARLVTPPKTPGVGAPVPPGDGQQGLRPGLGGRGTRDNGQAQSAADAAVQALAGAHGSAARKAAQRAAERARALPAG